MGVNLFITNGPNVNRRHKVPKRELQSLIAFLKSEIIRTESIAERYGQELYDLHLRLEAAEIDMATKECDEN